MNFFRSILLDDPEPPKPENSHEPSADSPRKTPQEDRGWHDVARDGNAEGWGFGGLMKTFATRSESVIETYRRDLQEFGSGLRKETETIREAASRAVKDLPASLEAGTLAAHGVLDGVLKSTADVISKEVQIFASDGEPETNRSLNPGRYSWFEAQLNAIQSDSHSFCEDPEDVEDHKKWKLKFELEARKDETEGLAGENGILEGVYKRFVPSAVDHETFWCRYFYRVDKLKQQEKVRANLMKRAISGHDDDDLSWDVDGDDENDGNVSDPTNRVKVKGGDGAGDTEVSDGILNPVEKVDGSNAGLRDEKGVGGVNEDGGNKNNVVESRKETSRDASLDEKDVKSDEVAAVKIDNKVKSEDSVKEKNEENTEKGGAGEKIDVSVISDRKAKMEEEEEEEDLGWDEIEDSGSGDENKISTTSRDGRPNRVDLRKRLNAAEDDEDLSWDIEDDDEPVKS